MSALDRLIPVPRLHEIDHVDLAGLPEVVWDAVRHGNLARSPLIRALFALREIPARLAGRDSGPAGAGLTIDDIVGSTDPGFHRLAEDPGHEIAIGAIGKVWEANIPFADVRTAEDFVAFAEPEHAKVAWAIRVTPRGEADSRCEIEVRVGVTDDAAWEKFRRYFRLIGPFSRFIRHLLLAELARRFRTPEHEESYRHMIGDELLDDVTAQVTYGVTIAAAPAAIWPWLVQMGAQRAGFYSVDLLDNGGTPSAKEIHPELQAIAVGDVLRATPAGDEGFEVLRIEPQQALVLGGLYDLVARRQRRFADPRPEKFWQVTWTFVLEPLDASSTRLHVRARVAQAGARFRTVAERAVHALMQPAQLRGLRARVEGSMPRDGVRDVAAGVVGAAGILIDLLTPFLRGVRSTWGIDATLAARVHPGDELVPSPHWSWTHAIEIDAPPAEVWPWVRQIGADRAGFYSYQWLENLVGCEVRNAETIHPEWAVHRGDALRLHPKGPALEVRAVEDGHYFVGFGPPDEQARAEGRPWASASWLFLVEPLDGGRSRFVSRLRCACSDDVATRLMQGPYVGEAVGFVMDRRMLLGVKERVERRLAGQRSGWYEELQ